MNAQQMVDALLPIKVVHNGTACASCMASSDDLVACSACKHARYCSRDCQKSNWTEHKPVCKILRSFRTVAPSMTEDLLNGSLLPGAGALKQKIHFLQILSERDPENPLVQTLQLQGCSKKTWHLAANYLQSCRCCSVCLKTEYDVPIGESKVWPHCPTCNFGWCCSEEHWREYEPRHTKHVCDLYVKQTGIDRFRYEHTKNYGDKFAHTPQTVCSAAMEAFPRSWEEYFEKRCPEEYGLRDRLPKEFFPAATHELSQTATCLYGMYEHDKDFFTRTKNLTVHVVGPSPSYEMSGGGPTCIWEEIMHCLPAVTKMNIVFVGPEACDIFSADTDKVDAMDISCCPDCTGKNRRRTQAFHGKTYHEFARDQDIFSKPDLIVAFNTGMFEEDKESWKTSLGVIIDMDVPCCFTSYNKLEADGDFAVLANLGARTLTEGAVVNPYPVDCPVIDIGVDEFFKSNMYCICFRGRK